jgi:type II secretory pathway pseudopilin PulG
MRPSRKASCPRPEEEGYVLAAVIIMLAVMMILLAAAVPKVREDIRRDQEVETMHRGQQYIRAVQLYYRKFHRFPPNVDALEDTNMMRFLRKKYDDPLTGKYDWTPVPYGANKAPLTMGYFGVPLTMGAAVLTGAAATGGNSGNQIVGASPIGSGSGFVSAFGPDQGSGNPGAGSGSPTPGSSMAVGGMGIQGFSPASTKESILVYKTKDHYNEWEFVYDPTADRVGGMPFVPPPGPPPVNTGAPGFGSPTPPPPTAPQQ